MKICDRCGGKPASTFRFGLQAQPDIERQRYDLCISCFNALAIMVDDWVVKPKSATGIGMGVKDSSDADRDDG